MHKASLLIVSAAAVAVIVSSASATPLFSTSFEPPTYNVGDQLAGTGGWTAGSGTLTTQPLQTVSADVASTGTQSVRFDNTENETFFSSYRGLGYNPTQGDPLVVSVDLFVTGNTGANRLYGVYLGSAATSTMGGTTLGLSIGGDGAIRAGTTWSATYQNSGLIGTAPAGTFKDRWLTVTFTYHTDPT